MRGFKWQFASVSRAQNPCAGDACCTTQRVRIVSVDSPERMGPVAAVVATEALQAEKLTLLVAENKTGYFGVSLDKRSKSLSPIKRG